MTKRTYLLTVILLIVIAVMTLYHRPTQTLPTVAIANYGPHASLHAAIEGFKAQMERRGFIENKTIRYDVADVGFDAALIPQMLASLHAKHPQVMLVMTTPVAQAAKHAIRDIPLVYSAITDPVEAGLIPSHSRPDMNMTGSSEMQNLRSFLRFAKILLPSTRRIGLLYATGESNDRALVKMMRDNAILEGMEVLAIPVEQARDVPMRMQAFKGAVDVIYVGTSGPIQPTLPAIAAEARKMHIPLFNAESQAVKDGLALGSFGVDYLAVGKNAGTLVGALLQGKNIAELTPLYPSEADHHAVISKKQAQEFGITIPANVEVVD